jgi:hypothetical protein
MTGCPTPEERAHRALGHPAALQLQKCGAFPPYEAGMEQRYAGIIPKSSKTQRTRSLPSSGLWPNEQRRGAPDCRRAARCGLSWRRRPSLRS